MIQQEKRIDIVRLLVYIHRVKATFFFKVYGKHNLNTEMIQSWFCDSINNIAMLSFAQKENPKNKS